MTTDFEIEYLDHVAIRVMDLERSAKWYGEVLGLKKYQIKKWGAFPIFMLTGKVGIALFPAENDGNKKDASSKVVKIDHFAFNVTRANFEKAKSKYASLGLDFEIQDHHYFDSIYVKDPDGHTVELTTLKVDEKEFYS